MVRYQLDESGAQILDARGYPIEIEYEKNEDGSDKLNPETGKKIPIGNLPGDGPYYMEDGKGGHITVPAREAKTRDGRDLDIT